MRWRCYKPLEANRLEPEQLRRIAPTHLEGINLRGTFIFPVGRYASRLLPRLAQDSKTLAAGQRA
jgi:hypothetical protein